MTIEERPIDKFNAVLKSITVTSNRIATPGFRHILNSGFIVTLPDVTTTKLGTVLSVKQATSTSTVLDTSSQYPKLPVVINHTTKVEPGSEVFFRLYAFAGHRRWIIVHRAEVVIPDAAIIRTLKGDPGEKGEPGKDGRDGEKGLDGRRGSYGLDGVDGDPGKDGKPGKNGYDGTDGSNGPRGKPGPRGYHGHNGVDGINANGIDRIYLDDIVYTCSDFYKHQTGLSYRYYGKPATVHAIYLLVYQIDSGKHQPLTDVLINGTPLLSHPHRLPSEPDRELSCSLRNDVRITSGDIIQFPTIQGSHGDAHGLQVIMEYKLN